MTRAQIETALKEGIPFQVKMADGEKYDITDRLQVAIGGSTVVIVDAQGVAHILPLLTMTGITYLKPR